MVESPLLPPDPAVVVIPLFPDYPAVKYINPIFEIDGTRLVLATRLIGAANRTRLRRVGHLADRGDEITRAIDILMGGV